MNDKSLFGSQVFGIAVVALLVVGSFFLGSLWTKVKVLEKGTVQPAVAGAQVNNAPTPPPNAAPPSFGSADNVEPLRANDHVKGNRQARILLIEYSDLECPFCKRFHPTPQQVVDEYKGQVAWVYRHFPLDQLHSKADKEAEAVECAGELGGNEGFWKLTDKIYEVTPSNNGLNLDDLPKLAGQVGLDQTRFNACLDSGKFAGYVEKDYQSGVTAGIQGTPGVILLDTKTKKTRVLPGAVPFEQVKAAVESLLKESS